MAGGGGGGGGVVEGTGTSSDGISGNNGGEQTITINAVSMGQTGCEFVITPLVKINNNSINADLYGTFDIADGEDPVTVNLGDQDVRSSDAFIVSVGAGFAALGGIGADITAVIINKGNQTGIYAYASFDMSTGIDASASIVEGPVDFNWSNNAGQVLGPETFSGKGESVSWGLGPYSGQYSFATTNGTWSGYSIPSGGNLLYSAVLSGAGVGATLFGARWNFSITTNPLASVSFSF